MVRMCNQIRVVFRGFGRAIMTDMLELIIGVSLIRVCARGVYEGKL